MDSRLDGHNSIFAPACLTSSSRKRPVVSLTIRGATESAGEQIFTSMTLTHIFHNVSQGKPEQHIPKMLLTSKTVNQASFLPAMRTQVPATNELAMLSKKSLRLLDFFGLDKRPTNCLCFSMLSVCVLLFNFSDDKGLTILMKLCEPKAMRCKLSVVGL